jgi:hypothetical protein
MIVVGMAGVAVAGAGLTALLGVIERRAMPWRMGFARGSVRRRDVARAVYSTRTGTT